MTITATRERYQQKVSTMGKSTDLKLFRIKKKKGICCSQAVLFAHLKVVLKYFIAIAVICRSQERFWVSPFLNVNFETHSLLFLLVFKGRLLSSFWILGTFSLVPTETPEINRLFSDITFFFFF